MPLDFQFLGDCHLIALALHRAWKLPLCLFYGERHSSKPETILIHMGVIFQGNFVDELGVQGPPEELLKQFLENNQPYSLVKIIEADALNHEIVNILKITKASPISESKILFFMEWIKNQPQFKFLH